MSGELERMIAEMRGEIEKLRKINSQHKETIHVLRNRCNSLTREMEELRARLNFHEVAKTANKYPSHEVKREV